ncbi:S1C family serine protease [Adhaeretor mobilis]|nr:PDZ domain-containing protein [Adhaeretor mobilis]
MKSHSTTMLAVLALCILGTCRPSALAQEAAPGFTPIEQERDVPFGLDQLLVPRWRLADGPHVRAAFRDVVRNASHSTARVRSDGKQVALGSIVGADGWILTKASPLSGDVTCRLKDGRTYKADIVGISGEHDLALLKIEATNLRELRFSSKTATVGSFVATVGTQRDPEAVGVVSVPGREVPPQPGVLGIQLDQANKPLVVHVFPESGAERAGVKENDLIIRINETPIPTRVELIETVRKFNPGDRVKLTLERDSKTLTVEATLSGRFPGWRQSRSQFQNSLGGKLSVRRFGFPDVFQHDTVLAPNQCGGPLVNLDGESVGVNIARSGRTETYALDVQTVTDLLFDLRSGKLAPRRPELEAAKITSPAQ